MCGGSLISAARTVEVGDALPRLLSNLSHDLLPAGLPGLTLHSHFHFLPVETQGFLQGPQPAHSNTITTLVSLQPLINVPGISASPNGYVVNRQGDRTDTDTPVAVIALQMEFAPGASYLLALNVTTACWLNGICSLSPGCTKLSRLFRLTFAFSFK